MSVAVSTDGADGGGVEHAESRTSASPPNGPTEPGEQNPYSTTPTPVVDVDRVLPQIFPQADDHVPTTRRSYSPQASRHTPVGSPLRRKSADAAATTAVMQIDPTLLDLDMGAGELTAKPTQSVSQVDNDPLGGDPKSAETPKTLANGLPWPLATQDLLSDSQPATSTSEASPSTPDLGFDGVYQPTEFGDSRQSSTSDFGSLLVGTKGISTTTSSESGYEPVEPAPNGESNLAGIPPPRPKKSHARKPPGHIKRARNAFILFRKHITDSNLIPPSVEVKHQNISVVAAKMWREAPQEVRAKFQEQARIEKEEHQRMYPGYRYQPVFRRTDIIRRRVRKDQAEDEKVEAVAEALIQGKTGEKLEKEIRDQMVVRSNEIASESEAESTRTPSARSRRRREVGQLSKGAIRAQRAQARAKQMRQNLLGSNLLNMSLYNAAQQGRSVPNHPGAQHHLQYAVADQYMPAPMGYELDPHAPHGMPYADHQAGPYPAPTLEMDANDMYRLPPIDGMNMPYESGWPGIPAPGGIAGGSGDVDYWTSAGPGGEAHPHAYPGAGAAGHEYPAGELGYQDSYYPSMQGMGEYDPGPSMIHQYQLPPLIDPTGTAAAAAAAAAAGASGAASTGSHGPEAAHPHAMPPPQAPASRADEPIDTRMHEWSADGQQTPSGHVLFNERLFDGALGSSALPSFMDGKDDGLAGFEEAMAQAGEIGQW